MSEEGITILNATKSANIIKCISELYNIPVPEATDIFYQSDTSQFIEDKVADLHCRSDKYLATLIWEEHTEQA